MADAFSLAVNIFTILEFGRKFAKLAWAIHKDGKDAVSKITSLDLTSKDLSKIASDLNQPAPSPGAHNQDDYTERIHQLATRCIQVAGQMQETISGLRMHTTSPRKGSAILKAFRYKWEESVVLAFHSEIEDLRSELMLNLIFWLRTGMMKSLEHQDRMIQEFSEFRSYDEAHKNRLDQLDRRQEGFVQQIVEILSINATPALQSSSYDRPQTSLENGLMNAMQNCPQPIGGEGAAKLQISASRLELVQNRFINIFRYDSMFDRETGVAEAHPDTLKWIFKDPSGETHVWDNFSHWLASEDQLYWITGKMGSGKSTLIRYISEELPTSSAAGRERRCAPYLVQWAEDQPLFIATFYFWAGSNEDTGIQTSLDGLYRTVLTQILEAYPESAPHVSPRRWEDLCFFNKVSGAPGVKELKVMLSKAINYVSSMAKICLFIDGLDEFEGGDDDLTDLIVWVKTLVATSPVKLCVASRPWRVFENALQDRPHLLMENFNFNDIQEYVWGRFHDDPNFRIKKQMEAAFCDQLLDDIVNKAEGVFLWVHIVCTHLLAAMSRGDLGGDLKRTLIALPVQMEKLYDHILDNLEFKDHAAKYFLLLQALLGLPDALIFSFADDIGEDNQFSLKMPKESLTDAQLRYRVTELRKRLNSRCRGILSLAIEQLDSGETTVNSDIGLEMGVIQYCHRSAKDYLTMDTVQDKLIHMLDAPFDSHLRLCSAYLARWKCGINSRAKHTRHVDIYGCLKHAARVDSESHDMMFRILDDMNSEPVSPLNFDKSYFVENPIFGGTLLCCAVVLGVSEYVKFKVGGRQGCVVRTSSFDLYSHETRSTVARDSGTRPYRRVKNFMNGGRLQEFLEVKRGEEVEWPLLLDALLATTQPSIEMVSLLLENGADPNLVIRGAGGEKSAMDVFLFRLKWFNSSHLSIFPDAKKPWVDSSRLLLQHGAKPDRSDARYLRNFIGEDVAQAMGLPHLGRHREFISKLFALFGRSQGRWSNG